VKFDRKKSWGWHQVKTNPEFPKPMYINKAPFFIEQEVDEYIRECANRSRRRA